MIGTFEMLPTLRFIEETVARLPEDRVRTLVMQAPRSVPDALLRDADTNCLLLARGDKGIAGLNVALSIRSTGQNRYQDIRKQTHVVFSEMLSATEPGVSAPPPRFFGGFAFNCGGADQQPWQGFGDASFVLPRWTYGTHQLDEGQPGRGWLRLTLAPGETGGGAEYTRFVQRLLRYEYTRSSATYVRTDLESKAAYEDRIESLTTAIENGLCEKVVAARRTDLTLDRRLPFTAPLGRLRERFPACQRFLFRYDDVSFLGATPERLIHREGDSIQTEALAGTIALGEHEKLKNSAKNQREHRLVIDAIQNALDPYVALSPIPKAPLVRELPGFLHLHTPIEGTLREPSSEPRSEVSSESLGETRDPSSAPPLDTRHVLSLVEALHPTPAVGGVPRNYAGTWIQQNESPRGWYASPIGSFDADGNGEFFVALRSGVLSGFHATAYAGGGIVSGSDPTEEYVESELKFVPFLGAIGEQATKKTTSSSRRPDISVTPA